MSSAFGSVFLLFTNSPRLHFFCSISLASSPPLYHFCSFQFAPFVRSTTRASLLSVLSRFTFLAFFLSLTLFRFIFPRLSVSLFVFRPICLDCFILLLCLAFSLLSVFLLVSLLPFPFFLPIAHGLEFYSYSQCHHLLQSIPPTTELLWASPPPRARAQSAAASSTTGVMQVEDLRQWRLQSSIFGRVIAWHAAAPAGRSSLPVVLATTEFSPPE